MFLIGEESLLLGRDGDVDRDPDPTIAIEDFGGRSCRRSRSHRLPATLRGSRGLALIGLAVGAAGLAALRPWGARGPDRPPHIASPRSPLISRSAAALPPARSLRVHHPAARAADVPPHSVHHQRSRRAEPPAPPRPDVIQNEPEREPTPQVAPVSSPAVTTTTEAAPEPDPGPTAGQMPPSPPPSSSGGGPGGVGSPPSSPTVGPATVETFGFER